MLLALTLTLALHGYTLKLLTLTPGKAWSCGQSKGGSVLNRKGCDALASQSCCVTLDHSFYSHTSGPAVPSSSHLSVPYLLQCLGVFLPSSLTSERATPSSFFLQLCPSWNLQAPRPAGPCKNESRLPPFRDLKCTVFSGGQARPSASLSSATVPTLGRSPRGVTNVC